MGQIVSKDVLDSGKVMENIDENPGTSIKELTRIMVENVQRQQLNDLDVKVATSICAQLKAASNNIFWKWNMEKEARRPTAITHKVKDK